MTFSFVAFDLKSRFMRQRLVEGQITRFCRPRWTVSCFDFPLLNSNRQQYSIAGLWHVTSLEDIGIPDQETSA